MDGKMKSDTLNPLATGGPAAAGLFELKTPAQYLFSTRGNAKLSRDSRLVTRLSSYSTGKSWDLCGADAGFGIGEKFVIQTNASLLLDPGIYNWISEIRPNPADQIDEIYLTASVASSPEACETRGVREAFSMMSGPQGRKVFARGLIETNIGPSELLSAQVVVRNLATNQVFKSGVLELIGNSNGPVSTGVVPYIVAANQLFLASLKINYAGTGRVSCLLRQRWDHE
jgi:hypothetical protein